MSLTLELVLLNIEWGPSHSDKGKFKYFVYCFVYDRVALSSRNYRLDIGGPPVAVQDISAKDNCFLWLRVSREKKNLLGQLKQSPVPGVDHIGLDLAQAPNLAPNYRVPNDPVARVNVTLQARWMGGKMSQSNPIVPNYVAPMVVSKDRPKWQFFREEDKQWVDYSPLFCDGINQGLESGYTSFKFNGIHFMIEGQTGTHRNKKSNSSRPIRCVPNTDVIPYSIDGLQRIDSASTLRRSSSDSIKPGFNSLGPFGVIPYINLLPQLQLDLVSQTYQLADAELLGPPFSRFPFNVLRGRLSQEARIPSMAEADAVNACIPRGAWKYVFLYPLEVLAGCEEVDYHDPRHAALSLGAFIYLDSRGRCLSMNGITASGQGIYFSERYKVPKRTCPTHIQSLFSTVVYSGFIAVGARRFIWLPAGEECPGMPVRNLQGALLFEMSNDAENFAYFAVQSVDPIGTLFVAHTVASMQANAAGYGPPDATFKAYPTRNTLTVHKPEDAPPPPSEIPGDHSDSE